jgi:hypothetical protein
MWKLQYKKDPPQNMHQGDATEATNIRQWIVISIIITKRTKYWIIYTAKQLLNSTYIYISVQTFAHTYMHHVSPSFHNVVVSVIATLSTLSALYCPSQLISSAIMGICNQRWGYNANTIYFDDIYVTLTSLKNYTFVPCQIRDSHGSEYQDHDPLGCDVWIGKGVLTFQRNPLP